MDQEEIREIILDEIADLEGRIRDYREQAKPVSPDSAIGRITRMDAIGNRGMAESSLRNAEEKLYNLELALRKIGTPDFGVCARCGRPIAIERILYMPESVYCVSCAK